LIQAHVFTFYSYKYIHYAITHWLALSSKEEDQNKVDLDTAFDLSERHWNRLLEIENNGKIRIRIRRIRSKTGSTPWRIVWDDEWITKTTTDVCPASTRSTDMSWSPLREMVREGGTDWVIVCVFSVFLSVVCPAHTAWCTVQCSAVVLLALLATRWRQVVWVLVICCDIAVKSSWLVLVLVWCWWLLYFDCVDAE
jgi:hypothetical protein